MLFFSFFALNTVQQRNKQPPNIRVSFSVLNANATYFFELYLINKSYICEYKKNYLNRLGNYLYAIFNKK